MIDEKLFPFIFWWNLKHCQRLTESDLDILFGYLLDSHLECPDYPFPVLVDLSQRYAKAQLRPSR